jgi:hypothetical protein
VSSFARTVPTSKLVCLASVEELSQDVSQRIFDAAKNSTQCSTGNPFTRPSTPSWDDECRERVRARRRALLGLQQHSSQVALKEYKRCAEARYCIRQHKQAYQRQFIESITYTITMSRGWKKIHMMRQMTHLSYPLTHN